MKNAEQTRLRIKHGVTARKLRDEGVPEADIQAALKSQGAGA